jgi:hypothetical protein
MIRRFACLVFWGACCCFLSCHLQAADQEAASHPGVSSPSDHSRPVLARWIDFSSFTVALREKLSQDDLLDHRVVISLVQYQVQLLGRIKLDPRGRFSVITATGTGNRFMYSWNRTGIGEGRHTTNLYVKQLYFDANPTPWLQVSFGSLGFVRNNSTEITSYSNNGYLAGERISIRKPKKLFFDEVHLVVGYLGDLTAPSFFSRMDRFGSYNYYFLGANKKLPYHSSLSFDITEQSERRTLRQAFRIQFPRNIPVQEMTFENYQRYHPDTDFGFAWHAQRQITRKLRLWGGFSSVDKDYGPWNSDRLGRGNRFFLVSSYELIPDLTFSISGTYAVNTTYPIANRRRLDFALGYNLLNTLRRTGWF